MAKEEVLAYTDGGCIGNPGPGGWGVRVRYPGGRVKEFGGREPSTTNNRMELRAVIEALRRTEGESSVRIIMDSEYVRGGITSWLQAWKARGWMTQAKKPVANQDLWQELDDLLRPGVSFAYTAGHAGDPDNERCDRIANGFARGEPPELRDGVEEGAPAPLARGAAAPKRTPAKRGSKAKGSKPVYLSYVGGQLERHATWAECEARVRGVSGARYKKCLSPEEEEETLLKWGIAGRE